MCAWCASVLTPYATMRYVVLYLCLSHSFYAFTVTLDSLASWVHLVCRLMMVDSFVGKNVLSLPLHKLGLVLHVAEICGKEACVFPPSHLLPWVYLELNSRGRCFHLIPVFLPWKKRTQESWQWSCFVAICNLTQQLFLVLLLIKASHCDSTCTVFVQCF